MSLPRFCFLVAGISLLPAIVSAQPLTFQRDDHASLSGARGIATADFNRDGWIDLVTAHNNPDGVSVLINRGAAGGYASSFIDLPGGPFDVATGDLNKDGLADIAVANADANEINLLFGRSEGGFTTPLNLPGGGNPRGLAIADVDRDGRLDIVFTEFGAARVTLYWGDGAGSFSGRPPVSLSTPPNPQGVAVADFDVDGRPDIATVSAAGDGNGVTIHFANPTAGSFWRWDITWTPQLNVIAIGDLDKDGRPDIAAAGANTSDISTLLNTRAGWSLRAPFPSGGSSPRGIAVADLNRDGALDLITGNRGSNTVQVALNRGDGSFAAPQGIGAGAGSRAVAVGDFDHDGRVDLASANEYAPNVSVLSNATAFPRTAFSFRMQVMGPGDGNSSSGNAVAVADFDEDGRLDAAVNDQGVTVRFAADGRTANPVPFEVTDMEALDVNRDGHADLVVLSRSTSAAQPSRIAAFLGDGTGKLLTLRTSGTTLVGVDMELADFDRDGRVDLVLTGRTDWSGENRMQVFRGTGDGLFALVAGIPMQPDESGELAVGDVDRDGDLDLVTGTRVAAPNAARVLTRLSDGNFGFGTPRATEVANFFVLDSGQLADLNHDGFLDYVGHGYPHGFATQDRFAVLLGGPSGFGTPTYLRTRESGLGVSIGDLTMDGNDDIISDDGVLYKGNGDGTFAEQELFDYYAPGTRIVDFNGDALPDIVGVRDHGSAIVILNQRGETNTAPVVDLTNDFTIQYRYQFGDGELELWARASDVDLHKPTFKWHLPDGTVVDTGTFAFFSPHMMEPGQHRFTVDVSDGRGGTATDSVVITVLPEKEIVLHVATSGWTEPHNNWQIVNDATAASGQALHDTNLGQPKVTTPSANPGSYVDVKFVATNTETYKIWVRLKADGDLWSNDSLWLQFSGAVDANGRSFAPGTTSGIEVNLEECSGCGDSGWGWRDEAWGQRDAIGVLTLKFAQNGWQTLRIQTREDGVSVDQVVLSSEMYRTTRPGAVKNDTRILPGTFYW